MNAYLPPRPRTPWKERLVLVWGGLLLLARCIFVPLALGACVVAALLAASALRDFLQALERLLA